MLFDNMVRMGARVMVPGGLPVRKAGYTEVEFMAGGTGASYSDLRARLAGARRV